MKMRLLFFSALIPLQAAAGQSHWFGGRDLDYWNEGKTVRGFQTGKATNEAELLSKIPVSDSVIRSADFLPFDWNSYSSPMSPLFWDDGGNYVPPRPLRQLAAFPTNENFAKYREWQRLKNQTIADIGVMLSADVAPYASQNRPIASTQLQRNEPPERDRRSSAENGAWHNVDWTQVTATFVYRSSCPHCVREIPIVEKLKAQGAKIMALQLNSDSEKPIFPNSVPLSPVGAQKLDINVTPTLILTANGKSVRLEGYAPESQLLEEAGRLF